jgi:hypothetical protein
MLQANLEVPDEIKLKREAEKIKVEANTKKEEEAQMEEDFIALEAASPQSADDAEVNMDDEKVHIKSKKKTPKKIKVDAEIDEKPRKKRTENGHSNERKRTSLGKVSKLTKKRRTTK